jgi:hypothetical protein
VLAGLAMSSVVDAEEASAGRLDRAEAVYRANLEMRYLRQEVVRVVLLDAQNGLIMNVEVCKGTVDKCVVYPREIFRPVIVYGAAGFVVVHNHPSGGVRPSPADIRWTERLVKGARILRVRLLDHVIVGRGLFHQWSPDRLCPCHSPLRTWGDCILSFAYLTSCKWHWPRTGVWPQMILRQSGLTEPGQMRLGC